MSLKFDKIWFYFYVSYINFKKWIMCICNGFERVILNICIIGMMYKIILFSVFVCI